MTDIKGIVYKIGETQDISAKFKKRELVVHVPNGTNPKWDNYYLIEATQDKVGDLDGIKVGENVTVSVFLNGNKWEKDGVERFFNSIRLGSISIDVSDKGPSNAGNITHDSVNANGNVPSNNSNYQPQTEGEDDDLPF